MHARWQQQQSHFYGLILATKSCLSGKWPKEADSQYFHIHFITLLNYYLIVSKLFTFSSLFSFYCIFALFNKFFYFFLLLIDYSLLHSTRYSSCCCACAFTTSCQNIVNSCHNCSVRLHYHLLWLHLTTASSFFSFSSSSSAASFYAI